VCSASSSSTLRTSSGSESRTGSGSGGGSARRARRSRRWGIGRRGWYGRRSGELLGHDEGRRPEGSKALRSAVAAFGLSMPCGNQRVQRYTSVVEWRGAAASIVSIDSVANVRSPERVSSGSERCAVAVGLKRFAVGEELVKVGMGIVFGARRALITPETLEARFCRSWGRS